MGDLRQDGDIVCTGTVRASGGFSGPVNRSNLITDDTAVYELPLFGFRIWDALGTNLTTAANDDLGISNGSTATYGVFGTGTPFLVSRDLNGLGTQVGYARITFVLPPEYVSGGTITCRLTAGCHTGSSANVDVEAYLANRAMLVSGTDLVTTTATAVTGTFGAKNFTLTPTSRVAGDMLDLRVAIIGATTVVSTIVAIPHVEMVLQIRG